MMPLTRCLVLFALLFSQPFLGVYAHESGKDHKHDHDHDHKHDHGHDHPTIVVGPNGGRVLTEVEPHVEFFVTKDRKVKLTFLNEKLKPIPAAKQTATVFAGDRSAPTRLGFKKAWGKLVSDGKLPEGNNFPTVIQIKVTPDAAPALVKFNLNLADCPTCDNQEYACACDHHHHDH